MDLQRLGCDTTCINKVPVVIIATVCIALIESLHAVLQSGYNGLMLLQHRCLEEPGAWTTWQAARKPLVQALLQVGPLDSYVDKVRWFECLRGCGCEQQHMCIPQKGMTPLLVACQYGHCSIVEAGLQALPSEAAQTAAINHRDEVSLCAATVAVINVSLTCSTVQAHS